MGAGMSSGKSSSERRAMPGALERVVEAVTIVREDCGAATGAAARVASWGASAKGGVSADGCGAGVSIQTMTAMAGSARAVARRMRRFGMAKDFSVQSGGIGGEWERISSSPENRLVPGCPGTSLSFQAVVRAWLAVRRRPWPGLRGDRLAVIGTADVHDR